MKRFSSSGQTAVISMEMALPASSSTMSFVTVAPTQVIPQYALLDSMPQVKTREPPSKELLLERRDNTERDLPRVRIRSASMEVLVVDSPRMKRRDEVVALPQPITVVQTRRPRVSLRKDLVRPVTSSNPMEQFVGLEQKTDADLSKNQPPAYPIEAVERRLEGVVMLRLSVNAVGEVVGVEVAKSSGHVVLDEAAVVAVRSWKGAPAKRWGQSVSSTEVLPIRFRL